MADRPARFRHRCRAREQIHAGAQHLAGSAVWADLRRCDREYVILPDLFASFSHQGVTVLETPDLVYSEDGFEVVICA